MSLNIEHIQTIRATDQVGRSDQTFLSLWSVCCLFENNASNVQHTEPAARHTEIIVVVLVKQTK